MKKRFPILLLALALFVFIDVGPPDTVNGPEVETAYQIDIDYQAEFETVAELSAEVVPAVLLLDAATIAYYVRLHETPKLAIWNLPNSYNGATADNLHKTSLDRGADIRKTKFSTHGLT